MEKGTSIPDYPPPYVDDGRETEKGTSIPDYPPPYIDDGRETEKGTSIPDYPPPYVDDGRETEKGTSIPDYPPPYIDDEREVFPPDTDFSPTMASHGNNRQRSIIATLIPMFTVIFYVGVLIASMVALGYTADTDRDMDKLLNKVDKTYCILYIKIKDGHIEFSKGHACDFVVYGNAGIGFLAILLIILAVIKAVLGRWSTPAVVFDFCLLILGVLLSFSVGIVLSVGLSYTCDEIEKQYDNSNCKTTYIYSVIDDSKVFFYTRLHHAELTTWSIFGILFFMSIVESFITCIAYFIRKRRHQVPYQGLY